MPKKEGHGEYISQTELSKRLHVFWPVIYRVASELEPPLKMEGRAVHISELKRLRKEIREHKESFKHDPVE